MNLLARSPYYYMGLILCTMILDVMWPKGLQNIRTLCKISCYHTGGKPKCSYAAKLSQKNTQEIHLTFKYFVPLAASICQCNVDVLQYTNTLDVIQLETLSIIRGLPGVPPQNLKIPWSPKVSIFLKKYKSESWQIFLQHLSLLV